MSGALRSAGTGAMRSSGVFEYGYLYFLRPQVLQHGQDAPVILGRRREPQLPEDARHVLLDRAERDHHSLRDCLVRAPLGHQLEYLALARRQVLERIVAPAAADELRDHRWIERRPAFAHAPDGGR